MTMHERPVALSGRPDLDGTGTGDRTEVPSTPSQLGSRPLSKTERDDEVERSWPVWLSSAFEKPHR